MLSVYLNRDSSCLVVFCVALNSFVAALCCLLNWGVGSRLVVVVVVLFSSLVSGVFGYRSVLCVCAQDTVDFLFLLQLCSFLW